MGYQILRTPPFSSSKALIFSKLVSPPNLAPTSLFKTHFRPFVSKPIVTVPNSATGFGGASFQFQQNNRSFPGGVVTMAAAPGKFKKSEEWQAILSPEQFRILRQKGTE